MFSHNALAWGFVIQMLEFQGVLAMNRVYQVTTVGVLPWGKYINDQGYTSPVHQQSANIYDLPSYHLKVIGVLLSMDCWLFSMFWILRVAAMFGEMSIPCVAAWPMDFGQRKQRSFWRNRPCHWRCGCWHGTKWVEKSRKIADSVVYIYNYSIYYIWICITWYHNLCL